jgi:hypothetical protein
LGLGTRSIFATLCNVKRERGFSDFGQTSGAATHKKGIAMHKIKCKTKIVLCIKIGLDLARFFCVPLLLGRIITHTHIRHGAAAAGGIQNITRKAIK